MILFVSRYQTNHMLSLCRTSQATVGVLPTFEPSQPVMESRIRDALSSNLGVFIDMQWHRDATLEPAWVGQWLGANRNAIRSSTPTRLTALQRIGGLSRTLIAPSGPPDASARTLQHAREVVALRNRLGSADPIRACFVITRAGLHDASVVAGMAPMPAGVDEVSIAVVDAATYPSIWSEADWFEWLRLVGAMAQDGYRVVVPYSDVRGLIALGVGAADFGTGAPQALRQLRTAVPASSTGGGGNSSVSYMSIPLLAVLHGLRTSVATGFHTYESISPSIPGGSAILPRPQSTFDPAWLSVGQPKGDVDRARLSQHMLALAAFASYVQSQSSPADAVEQHLDRAARLAQRTTQDLFREPGSKVEAMVRLSAFRRVRQALGI